MPKELHIGWGPGSPTGWATFGVLLGHAVQTWPRSMFSALFARGSRYASSGSYCTVANGWFCRGLAPAVAGNFDSAFSPTTPLLLRLEAHCSLQQIT